MPKKKQVRYYVRGAGGGLPTDAQLWAIVNKVCDDAKAQEAGKKAKTKRKHG